MNLRKNRDDGKIDMCGISGIYSDQLDKDYISGKIKEMIHSIHHRGPDDEGNIVLRLNNNWLCALGHRRLSILDPTSAGHQPMSLDDGSVCLVFNGEIYNYEQIRRELPGEYKFRSGTDTEVVLCAYHAWGLDCFKKFNGMWAIAIVDKAKNTLILSRDRLGIKPLYYTWIVDSLIFASEIKALLAFPEVGRNLNIGGFLDYLSYRYVLGENTLYKDIYSLLPGHHLIMKNNSMRMMQYWDLPVIDEKPVVHENDALSTTSQLFRQAVEYRKISDVPIGAYLSGGLDSSAIVAQMSQFGAERVKTFTIGFEDEGFNEFEFASAISDYYKTDHHQLMLGHRDYWNILPDVISIKDAPLSVPNEVALYVLSRELKRYISVVLSGEGADELFGGYGRIFRSAFDYLRIREMNRNGFDASTQENRALRNNLILKYGHLDRGDELNHFLLQYTYLPLVDKLLLLNNDITGQYEDLLNRSYFEGFFNRLNGLNLYDKYIWLFQKIHLVGLLHRLDTTTMAYAVEARVPFVDHALIEYVSALSLDYKMRWKSSNDEAKAAVLNSNQISETHDITKYLLRKMFECDIPETILQRRKVGFPVPLNQWMQMKSNEMIDDLIFSNASRCRDLLNIPLLKEWSFELKNGLSKHGFQIWMVVNLELWMRQYKVTI